MNWCPRCDTLTLAKPGALCDDCGAEIADVTRLRGRQKPNGRRVLELDTDAAVVAPERPSEIRARVPSQRRNGKRITALLVALTTLALATTAYGLTRRHTAARNAHRPPVVSSPNPKPTPPFGPDLMGRLALLSDEGLTLINLADGNEEHVDLPDYSRRFTPSPDLRMSAFVDTNGFLFVYPGIIHPEQRVPLAGEVTDFKWSPDSKRIIVARRHVNASGRQRNRIESIDVESHVSRLLYEGYLPVVEVHPSSEPMLFETYTETDEATPCCDVEGNSAIYALHGRTPRLVLDRYFLLDVSPDGRTAFVMPDRGSQLFLFDIATKRLRRVGPASFKAESASFGPDGSAILIGRERVWSLDIGTLKLSSVAAPPKKASRWGFTFYATGRWIAFLTDSTYAVLSLDTGRLIVRPVDPDHAPSSVAFI